MKTIQFFKLFSMALVLSTVMACQSDDEVVLNKVDGKELQVDQRTEFDERPAEIPDPDEWILTAPTEEGPLDWREIDDWYRNDLLKRDDDPSVPNLKSITLDMLVQRSNFLEEAGEKELLFYAREVILDDEVRGNPTSVAAVLTGAAEGKTAMNGELENREIMKLAAQAEQKYFGKAPENGPEGHEEAYSKAVGEISSLHRVRWGESVLDQ